MKKAIVLLLILSTIMMLSGCASMSNTAKGTAIGATAGGVLGGIIGHKAGNTAAGAILGAAIGGAAGAIIGNYMDKQAAEIERDIEGARVERVGEGIKITFDSGILFAVDRAMLQDEAKANLEELAGILNKYEDTVILIEGHTDATGSEEYNLDLSKKRAQAVANHLSSNGVLSTRFTLMGYGESQPIASNETVNGRQENRRVEVAIMANDKLKKAAEEQAAG
jgi:outer membrane protein OmpA-like peptidoglycan-associated protein